MARQHELLIKETTMEENKLPERIEHEDSMAMAPGNHRKHCTEHGLATSRTHQH